ncbi:hypothetical protein CF640_37870 [Burkholderia pseudomallei]|nr:hypothetical protein CF640_37870 [Burkholderia pseudomallei]
MSERSLMPGPGETRSVTGCVSSHLQGGRLLVECDSEAQVIASLRVSDEERIVVPFAQAARDGEAA